jgi:hypothetical protein
MGITPRALFTCAGLHSCAAKAVVGSKVVGPLLYTLQLKSGFVTEKKAGTMPVLSTPVAAGGEKRGGLPMSTGGPSGTTKIPLPPPLLDIDSSNVFFPTKNPLLSARYLHVCQQHVEPVLQAPAKPTVRQPKGGALSLATRRPLKKTSAASSAL